MGEDFIGVINELLGLALCLHLRLTVGKIVCLESEEEESEK